MTKQELVTEISKRTGVDKFEVLKIVESLMESVKNTMIKGNDVFLRGFGTFHLQKRAAKKARNIKEKTTILIPEHYAPKFKPAKEFISKVKATKH